MFYFRTAVSDGLVNCHCYLAYRQHKPWRIFQTASAGYERFSPCDTSRLKLTWMRRFWIKADCFKVKAWNCDMLLEKTKIQFFPLIPLLKLPPLRVFFFFVCAACPWLWHTVLSHGCWISSVLIILNGTASTLAMTNGIRFVTVRRHCALRMSSSALRGSSAVRGENVL